MGGDREPHWSQSLSVARGGKKNSLGSQTVGTIKRTREAEEEDAMGRETVPPLDCRGPLYVLGDSGTKEKKGISLKSEV